MNFFIRKCVTNAFIKEHLERVAGGTILLLF